MHLFAIICSLAIIFMPIVIVGKLELFVLVDFQLKKVLPSITKAKGLSFFLEFPPSLTVKVSNLLVQV